MVGASQAHDDAVTVLSVSSLQHADKEAVGKTIVFFVLSIMNSNDVNYTHYVKMIINSG